MFLKKIFSVIVGSTAAQLIPILGSLIIARLFIPNDFGVYMSWIALVTITTVFLTGRLETSISVVKSGNRRYLAIISSVTVILCLSILSSLLLFGLYVLDVALLGEYSDIIILLIIPSSVFTALLLVWQSWAASDGKYRKLSYIRITQAAIITAMQIAAGFVFPSAESLIISHFCGLLISFILTLYILPLQINKLAIKANRIICFLKRNKKYAQYSLPASLMNSFSAQLPILIIATKFSPDIAGFFALTTRVLGMPLALIGRSILDVFKKDASEEYWNAGNCINSFNKTLFLLAISSLIFSIVTYFGAEKIFSLAFGDNWKDSGVIAIWLLPLYATRLISSPLSFMVYIAEKQRTDLIWQGALLILTLLVLNLPFSYSAVLLSYSYVSAFMYLIYLYVSYLYSKGKG